MDVRQFDKAAAVRSGWSLELQAISCRTGRGFPGTAGDAKRFTARAQRRADSFFVEEGLAEWEDELQEESDARFDQYMSEAFGDDHDAEEWWADDPSDYEFQPALDLDQLCLVFNGNHEYFFDGNGPGAVYFCRHGALQKVMETLINEGGSPFELTRDQALSYVTTGDDFGRWLLWESPEWWYEGVRS